MSGEAAPKHEEEENTPSTAATIRAAQASIDAITTSIAKLAKKLEDAEKEANVELAGQRALPRDERDLAMYNILEKRVQDAQAALLEEKKLLLAEKQLLQEMQKRAGEPQLKRLRLARIDNADQPSSFLRFIQVIPKAENKDGFLNFTEVWWGRGIVNVPLLIRDCYAFFYDTLLEEYASRAHSNMVLTGTPGTGKSAFGLYAVWRLITEKKLSVLYEVKDNPTVLFASKPMEQLGITEPGMYQVALSQKEETILELCEIKELMRIQDPIDGVPIRVPGTCFNLIVSSPDVAKFKILSKDEAKTILLYMDLWNEEEMVLAAKEMKTKGIVYADLDLDEETVRKRYNKYGGSARHVFNSDADIDFENAMKLANKTSIMDLLSIDKQKGNLSAMLVHYTPVLPEKRLAHAVIASPVVASMLIEKYKVKHREQLKSFVASYKDVKDLQGFRGTVYESLMHDVLMRGGDFELEDEDNQKHKFKIPPLNAVRFNSKLSELSAANVNEYYLPLTNNFTALDSVVFLPRNLFPGGGTRSELCVVGFQMAVGPEHELKASAAKGYGGLNDVFSDAQKLLKYKPEMFIILVTDNAELTASQKIVGRLSEDMEQYVLRRDAA